MSDPYRRSRYDEDEEPPLRFDDRRGRARGGGGPTPVTLILSLLVLAGVGGGVFYMYRGGTRGPRDAPVPVGAPVGDVRTAAPPQAQPADPAAGLSIYKDDPNTSVPPAFVAPPEQPAARPAAPIAAVPSAPKPKATPTSVDDILAQTPTAPAPPSAVKASPPKTKPAAVAAAATAGGPAVVQIGAFSSASLADSAWSAAAAAAPGAMAGKGKRVVAMEKDGTTLYRTAITGFASRDAATALCDKLKAAGESCFVR